MKEDIISKELLKELEQGKWSIIQILNKENKTKFFAVFKESKEPKELQNDINKLLTTKNYWNI